MNKFTNNKGITLTALVVAIILLIALAGVGISTGKSSIESARLTAYGTELITMQNKVNELEQKFSKGEEGIDSLGTAITGTAQEDAAFDGKGITSQAERSKYRHYDKATLNSLGLQNFNQEFLVNVEDRKVISLTGIKYRGKTIWAPEDLDDGTFNVDYSGIDSAISFNVSTKANEIIVKNIRSTGDSKKYSIYYGISNNPNGEWKIAKNDTTETSCIINVSKDGNYYVKVVDSAGNYRVSDSAINVDITGTKSTDAIAPVVANRTYVYDGQPHSIEILQQGSGGTLKYKSSTDGGNTYGEWQTTLPTITNYTDTQDGTLWVQVYVEGDSSHNDSEVVTAKVQITKQSINGPQQLQVTTAGIVTWQDAPNATSYEISLDNNTWQTATSGTNYLTQITSQTGERTIYVRTVTENSQNFEATDNTSSIKVDVYGITFASNNTALGTVAPTTYNVISGATVEVNENTLKVKSGETELTTVTATPVQGNLFNSWSKTSGAITAETTITANFEVKEVVKQDNPITVTAPTTELHPGETIDLSTNVSNAQGNVTYQIKTNGTTTPSTLSGSNLTLGAMSSSSDENQTVVITVIAEGNENYKSASKEITVTVQKYTRTIEFTNQVPNSINYNQAITAEIQIASGSQTGGTATPLTNAIYTSGTEAVITASGINGKILTAVASTGSSVITATLPRTSTVKQATVTKEINVGRAREATAEESNKTYNGESQRGVTGNHVTWTETLDATDAGTYTAKATPEANYAWSDGTTEQKTITWKINAKEVEAQWGTETIFTYDGEEHAPTVTVESGIAGETITVNRTTQTNTGSHTSTASIASVTGGRAKTANYTLTNNTKQFTILQETEQLVLSATTATAKAGGTINLSEYVTSSQGNVTYAITTNGTTTASSVNQTTGVVTLGEMSGSNDDDQQVVVTITASATGNFSAQSKTFTITVQKYTRTIEFTNTPSTLTYNEVANAQITVSGEGGTASTATEAVFTSENENVITATGVNGKILTAVSAGGESTITATLPRTTTVKQATTTKTITVTKQSVTIPTVKTNRTYTGSEQSPEWNDYDTNFMTIGGQSSGINKGTYTATFNLKDTTNYQWSDSGIGQKSLNWTIGAKDISGNDISITLDHDSFTYNSSEQTPTVTVRDTTRNAILSESDYTLSYRNSTTNNDNRIVTGTITIIVTGKGNYTGTNTSKTYTINKKAPTLSVNKSEVTLTHGGNTDTVTITYNGDGTLGATSANESVATVSLNEKTITVTPLGVGNTTITVTATEGTNYQTATEVTFTVTVGAATMSLSSNNYSGIYDGESHTIVGPTVTIPASGNTIYYRENLAINASDIYTDNTYTTVKSSADLALANITTTSPEKINAGTTTVYWYVKSGSNQYSDRTGNNTITITQATVVLSNIPSEQQYVGKDLEKTIQATASVPGNWTVTSNRADISISEGANTTNNTSGTFKLRGNTASATLTTITVAFTPISSNYAVPENKTFTVLATDCTATPNEVTAYVGEGNQTVSLGGTNAGTYLIKNNTDTSASFEQEYGDSYINVTISGSTLTIQPKQATSSTITLIIKEQNGNKTTTINITVLQNNGITLDNQNATTPGTTSVTATLGSNMPSITAPTKTGYTFNGYYSQAGGKGKKYYNSDGTSAAVADFTQNATLYAYWTANTYTVNFYANISSRLPSIYQEVEYIQSTGSQYINTGVAPTNTLKTKFIYEDTSAENSNYVLGSRTGGAGTAIWYGLVGNASDISIRPSFNSTNQTVIAYREAGTKYDVTLDVEHDDQNGYRMHTNLIDLTNNITYQQDTPYQANGLTELYPNIFVFAIKAGQVHRGMKLYSLQFYDENTLIKDYIPCYRISDGTSGLYETIGGVFYTSADGQNFEVGSEVSQEHDIVTQQFTYDVPQNLINNPFEITGSTFTNWNTKQDNTGNSYNNGQSITNLTAQNGEHINLYAQWITNHYSLTFNANGGTGTMESMNLSYGQSQTLPQNTFTKEGNHFIGWNTQANGRGKSYDDREVVGNLTENNNEEITLYAQWKTNTYSVEYNYAFPDDYQQVEYIETTGSQIIDTGVTPTNTLKTEIEYMDTSADGSNYVLGSRTGEAGSEIWYGLVGSASDLSIGTYYNSTEQEAFTTTRTLNTTYKATLNIEYNQQKGYKMVSTLEDKTAGETYNVQSRYYQDGITEEVPNIYVFGIKPNQTHRGMRLYSLKFYDDGELIRNFIPCYRKADNVIGLYDMRTGTFYANSGDGALIKGQDIPNEYHEKKNQQFTYDEAQNLYLNTITKENYTFNGWNTNPNGTGTHYNDGQEVIDLATENDAKIQLYAEWTINTYTVTFNAGEGGTVSPGTKDVTYGQSYGELPIPTKAGYTFDGWYTSANLGETVTAETIYSVSGNQTLYAHWTANNYNVYFAPNGGTVSPTSKQVTYGSAYGELPNPTRSYTATYNYDGATGGNQSATSTANYIFDGWYNVNNLGDIVIQEKSTNYNYTAIEYTVKPGVTYTITIDNASVVSGSATKFTTFLYDLTVWRPLDSARTDFGTNRTITLTCPEDADTSHNLQIIIYAGQDGSTANTSVSYTNVKIGTMGSVAENEYTNSTIVNMDKNHVLYAKWTGANITLPTPTKTGYSFDGWYSDAEKTQKFGNAGATKQLSSNVTLYAKWTVNTYTVTFDADGGTVDTASKQVTYNSQYGTLPIPVRDGYTFLGWNGKNLINDINEDNYSVYNHRNFTSTEFVDGAEPYVRFSGIDSSSRLDTAWYLLGNDQFELTPNTTYNLNFDVRSANGVQNVYLALAATSGGVGYTGIYDTSTVVDGPVNIKAKLLQATTTSINFDNDGNWHHVSVTINVPANVTEGKLVIGNDNPDLYGQDSYIDIKNIQLEEGSTATAFEPHYVTENTTVTTSTNHTLTAKWLLSKVASTAPTLLNTTFTYDGQPHTVETTSAGSGGTIQYRASTDGGNTYGAWQAQAPTITNVGTLYVQAQIVGDSNHFDSEIVTATVTIGTATMSLSSNNYSGTYDGNSHTIVGPTVTVPTSGNTVYYREGISINASDIYTDSTHTTVKSAETLSANNITTTSPAKTNVGNTTVYWYVKSGNSQYADRTGNNTITINQATVTLSNIPSGLQYVGKDLEKTVSATASVQGNWTVTSSNGNVTIPTGASTTNSTAGTFNYRGVTPNTTATTITVAFTPTSSNYATPEAQTFTVKVADCTVSSNSVTAYAEDDNQTITLGGTNAGTFTVANLAVSGTYSSTYEDTYVRATITNNTLTIQPKAETATPIELTIKEANSGKTVTITVNILNNIFEISLDNQSATTAGTTAIYEKYNRGYYLESGCTNQMTASTNGIQNPARRGYTFGGYYTEQNGAGTQYIDENGKLTNNASATNYTASGTLYAKWTPMQYTVTYDIAGGEGGPEGNDTAIYDQTFTTNRTYPTKTGYTFYKWADPTGDLSWTGWSGKWRFINGQYGIVNNTLALTARYNANVYNVSLNLKGGSATSAPITIYEKYNTGYYLENTCENQMTASTNGIEVPTKKGHIFGGFYTEENGAGIQYIDENGKITSNASTTNFLSSGTLYAKWTPMQYTVIYNANGGTGGPATETITFGQTFTVSTNYPTKAGYDFYKWYDPTGDNNWTGWSGTWSFANGQYGIENNTLTLTAQWLEIYNVVYDSDGGTGGPANDIAHYGQTYTVSTTYPTKTGYTFYKWVDPTGDHGWTNWHGTWAFSNGDYGITNKTLTLKAIYTPNIYQVSLDNQSATTGGTATIYEKYNTGYYTDDECANQMTTSTNGIEKPTKTGYRFAGYYTEQNGSGTQYIDENGNITNSASTTNYTDTGTLYAHWIAMNNMVYTGASDVEVTYDGSGYGLNISVTTPSTGATVYYSTSELTSSNYSSGQASSPTVTNVAESPLTVYWYIKSNNVNYYDASGHNNVIINPQSVSIPSQSGTLTYNGSEQSPSWNNYDSSKVTLGGATTGTNATTYTATFTLKNTTNYKWSDNSTTAKSVQWSIGKKAPSFSINVAELALTYGGSNGTITITYDGDGTLGATSNNTGIATASLNNKTITVSPQGAGSTTITITAGEGTNYLAGSNKTCTVTVGKATMSLSSNNYSGVYDGNSHTIVGPTVTTPASGNVIYYRENLAINASDIYTDSNYTTVKSAETLAEANITTTSPAKADAGTTTVYWYVKSGSNHYADRTGSNTITITQATVTLSNIPSGLQYVGKDLEKTVSATASVQGNWTVTSSNGNVTIPTGASTTNSTAGTFNYRGVTPSGTASTITVAFTPTSANYSTPASQSFTAKATDLTVSSNAVTVYVEGSNQTVTLGGTNAGAFTMANLAQNSNYATTYEDTYLRATIVNSTLTLQPKAEKSTPIELTIKEANAGKTVTVSVTVSLIKYTVAYRPNKATLPSQYKEIDYLESSGTQYIDTGVRGNNSNLTIEIKYAWAEIPSSYSTMLGAYQGEDYVTTRIIQNGASITYYNVNSKAGSSVRYSGTRTAGTIYTERLSSSGDNIVYETATGTETFARVSGTNTNNTICLFSASEGRSVTGKKRIYYFRLYDNGTLIRNMIPCYIVENGVKVGGMYDTVNSQFYRNAGTGNFIVTEKTQELTYNVSQNLTSNTFTNPGQFRGWNTAPDETGTSYSNGQQVLNLSSTPGDVIDLYAIYYDYTTTFNYFQNTEEVATGYYKLDYIESSKLQGQHINTGVNGNNNNLSFEVQYEWLTLPPEGEYQYILGSYANEDSNTTRILQYGADTTYFNINSKAGGGSGNYSQQRAVNTIYTETLEPTSSTSFRLTSNGNTQDVSSRIDGNAQVSNIYLFAKNGSNTGKNLRVYYLKIYDNGTLIRDMVPCYRLESGNKVGGMYDKVNSTFYPSLSTDGFILDSKTQTYTYEEQKNLLANTYTRDGYEFTGWNTSPDGSGTSYTDQQSYQNLTKANQTIDLYAQWRAITPTVQLATGGYNGTAYTSGTATQGPVYHTISTTSSKTVSKYQYSKDNGTTWADMPETDINSLNYTSSLPLSSEGKPSWLGDFDLGSWSWYYEDDSLMQSGDTGESISRTQCEINLSEYDSSEELTLTINYTYKIFDGFVSLSFDGTLSPGNSITSSGSTIVSDERSYVLTGGQSYILTLNYLTDNSGQFFKLDSLSLNSNTIDSSETTIMETYTLSGNTATYQISEPMNSTYKARAVFSDNTTSVASSAYTINIVPELNITSQPTNVSTIAQTSDASFTIATSGTANSTTTYQWYSATSSNGTGTAIEGATDSTYTIPANNVTTSLNGKYYYCVATTTYNGQTTTATSNRAQLTVVSKATITSGPTSVTTTTGQADASFSVTASGTSSPSFTYQWYWANDSTSTGTAINGATSSTYTIPSTSVTSSLNGRYYYCVVTQSYGGTTATVTSNRAPLIVTSSSNTVYNKNGESCVIPAGFTLSGVSEENDIANGAVIYNIPSGVTVDWNNPTSVENARKNYDQFVWVPVPNANSMFICTSSTASNGACNIQLVNGVAKCTTHNSENIAGKLYAMPDGETYNKNKSDQHYQMSYAEPKAYSGDVSNGITQDILQAEYNNMARSVLTNHGFWVGRYETSSMNTSAVKSIAGTTTGIAGVNWYNMYARQKSYVEGVNCYGGMISGAAWDAMLRFIDSDSHDVTHIGYVAHKSAEGITDLYETGNTNYPSTATVPYNDVVKNIYDLEGNVLEWTSEAIGSYKCGRGGGVGDKQSASFLFDSWISPSNTAGDVGSRMALFVKNDTSLRISSSSGSTFESGSNLTAQVTTTDYSGSLSVSSSNSSIATATISSVSNNTATLTVIPGSTGGTATITVTEGAGHTTVTYTVTVVETPYSVTANGTTTKYPSLATAYAGAKQVGADTITLTKDVTDTSILTVDTQDVTLNLQNYTITRNDNTMYVNGDDLTIVGTTANNTTGTITSTNTNTITVTDGTLNVNSGNIISTNSTGQAIYNNGATAVTNIGDSSVAVSTTSPLITGGKYGVNNELGKWTYKNGKMQGTTLSFYDNDVSEKGGLEDGVRNDYIIVTGTSGSYKTAQLNALADETNPWLPTNASYTNSNLNTGVTCRDTSNNEWTWVVVPKSITASASTIADGVDPTGTALETTLINYAATVVSDRYSYRDTYYSDAQTGLTSAQYNDKKRAMLNSIKEYGGFWIGKYEAGSANIRRSGNQGTTDTPLIQQDKYPYTYVTCSEANTLAMQLSTQAGGNGSLLFGTQWDLTVGYMVYSGGVSLRGANYDSTNMGNYINKALTIPSKLGCTNTTNSYPTWSTKTSKNGSTRMLLTTGAVETVTNKKNIVDLAGNVFEWTMEYTSRTNYPCAYRGGYCTYNGNYSPASKRDNSSTTGSNYGFGFRPCMYNPVVMPEASITSQPANVTTIAQSSNVSFSVTATGTSDPAFTYQWYVANDSSSAGSSISGATSSTYTIQSANVTTSLNGKYYYCEVTQSYSGVTRILTSNRAQLTVISKATITSQPTAVTAYIGDSSASFSVTAIGTSSPALTYQWYWASDSSSAGTSISGATSNTYTIAAADITTDLSGRYYYCVVTQRYSTATATITSNRAPLVVTYLTAAEVQYEPESNGWNPGSVQDAIDYLYDLLGTSYSPPVTTFTFTIAGTTYYAEEGMTWNDWYLAGYDNGDYEIVGGAVHPTGMANYTVGTSRNVQVDANDSIIEGHSYKVGGSGSWK